MDARALTSAIRAIDAAAAALGGLVDIGQLDPDQIRLLLEGVQRCAADGLVALDEERSTRAKPGAGLPSERRRRRPNE
ncbi:MAG: hypothetical protein WCY08_01820 [Rhodocyclaceae bacterium]